MEKQENNFVEYRQYIETHKPKIEEALRENLPLAPNHIETQFNIVLESTLFNGSDRICPILTLLGAELVGGKAEDVLPSSAAVEFIWTSSNIFDDLLTDSKTQDEKESLQEKFGESLTMLVGLGLLNASYPLIFVNHSGMPERALAGHSEIVECVGAAGFVGGLNVVSELEKSFGSSKSLELESVKHLRKSANIRLSLRLGAVLSGANYLELASLSRFAELLGKVFQLKEKESTFELDSLVEDTKRVLVENFPSNDARSCLIQLVEASTEK